MMNIPLFKGLFALFSMLTFYPAFFLVASFFPFSFLLSLYARARLRLLGSFAYSSLRCYFLVLSVN